MSGSESNLDVPLGQISVELDPVLDPLPSRAVLVLGQPESRASPAGPSRSPERRLAAEDYARLIKELHRVVNAITLPGTVVAVISKGDSQLINLKKRFGWHFPQGKDGGYAGYHPSESADDIAELERLREKGADYLLVPSPSFWWFEYYERFARHLSTVYRTVWEDENCKIYQLSNRAGPTCTRARTRLLVRRSLARSIFATPKAVRPEELRLAIDTPIPQKLVVGEGNAFCLAGWCYHPEAKITKLEVVCNGWTQPLKAWGIPRPDVKAAHYPHQDRSGRSLR